MTTPDTSALPGRLKGGFASAARSTSRLLARAADSVLDNSSPVGRSAAADSNTSTEAGVQIAPVIASVEALRASVDDRIGTLLRSVEGLREQVQSLAASDLAHQHQLVQIDDRLARIESVDDLRQLSEHWLQLKGITKVVKPDEQAHWRVNGGTWGDRDRFQVVRPAYLGPGPDGSSVVLQFGELAPVPDGATAESPDTSADHQPATTDPEAIAP